MQLVIKYLLYTFLLMVLNTFAYAITDTTNTNKSNSKKTNSDTASSDNTSEDNSNPENLLFQNLDNQISIGYGYTTMNAYNPNFSSTNYTTNASSINVHLEQLFDSNVWLAVDGGFLFSANQSGNSDFSFGGSTRSFGIPGSLTGKAGYSFNWSELGLQVIPYLTSGAILNYNGSSFTYDGFADSYYILYGGGARIEYAITPDLSVFFDQMVGYLDSQGTPVVNQSAMNYISTLGIRYNVTDVFQIGLRGTLNQLDTVNNIGADTASLIYRNTNQTSYGGIISFAYLYNSKYGNSFDNYENFFDMQLAHFDNSYNINYGFLHSTNSYSGGGLPTINSSLNTLSIDFTHLFSSNIWLQLNGGLITAINQANVPPGLTFTITPTYAGFPGSVGFNLGYAVTFPDVHMQVIPYFNGAMDVNINSYNIKTSSSLSYILQHDLYLQYGAGARFEYAPTKKWFIYADQLFAELNDRSTTNVDSWRSTTSLGTKYNIAKNVMLGISGFYDIITPTGTTYNPSAGINYALQQNTLGGLVSVGVNY
ncbi:MAG: hypothetical protein K0R14_1431 [Burkholderiales bacterium]|jgi:hypothetical protein|nr:hypothetical protein [Burkholderiales bacterium]